MCTRRKCPTIAGSSLSTQVKGRPGFTSAQNDPSVSTVPDEVSTGSINLNYHSQKVQVHSLHPYKFAAYTNSFNTKRLEQCEEKNNSQSK